MEQELRDITAHNRLLQSVFGRVESQKTMQIATAKAARLEDENGRLKRLVGQLFPPEQSRPVMSDMERKLDDLERIFGRIKCFSLRVANVQESRTSKKYVSFREEKVLRDLDLMTTRYNLVLAKLKEKNRAPIGKDDMHFVKSGGAAKVSSKPESESEELKKLRADLACSNRLRDEAESKMSAYEDLMLDHGITHAQMGSVLNGCVRADKLMVSVKKRKNGMSLGDPTDGGAFDYWKL
jgi:hypothetical protein